MNEDHPNFVGYLTVKTGRWSDTDEDELRAAVPVYQDPFTRSLTLTAPEVIA